MRAPLLCRIGLLAISGCIQIGAPPKPPVTNVAATSQQVGPAVVTVEVGWMAVNMRRVKILVEVFNPGLTRSDDFFLDTTMEGFSVAEGKLYMSLLLVPRQVHSYEVDFRLLDTVDSGRLTINLRRQRNGPPQWSTTLRFVATPEGPKFVGR